MKDEIWALICGQLRNEFEFFTTLCCLCDLRARGVVRGIVLSTWIGELSRVHNIQAKLNELDIFVVETDSIQDNEQADLGFVRQGIQVINGLKVIPAGALVLKCRTDYSNFDINRMDLLFSKKAVDNARKFGEFDSGYKNRIEVLRIGVSAPFAQHDTCFLGKKDDLEKMIVLDRVKLSLGESIDPDIYFFSGSFINAYSIIRDFFRYVSLKDYSLYMKHLDVERGGFELPNALNKFYALYFVIAYCCFSVCHEYALEHKEIELYDIFIDTELTQKAINNGPYTVEIRNNRIIEMIVEGRLKKTKGYIKLYREIEKIKEYGYAETLEFSDSDYLELSVWGERFFGVEGNRWLKPYKKAKCSTPRCYGEFEKVSNLLFSDYKVNKSIYSAIYDISSNKESYYNTIIKYLSDFREADFELYVKALLCSTRYLNEDVLFDVCQLIKSGRLSEENQMAASYIFERYLGDDRLFALPMSRKKLEAICMYVEYYFDPGVSSKAGRELYQRIISFFEMPENGNGYSTAKSIRELMEMVCRYDFGDERNKMKDIFAQIINDNSIGWGE